MSTLWSSTVWVIVFSSSVMLLLPWLIHLFGRYLDWVDKIMKVRR